jgi:hypothetical protein
MLHNSRGELRLNRDEELTQYPEEPGDELHAKLMRERFDRIWHGTVGRTFRHAATFTVVFLFISWLSWELKDTASEFLI